MARAGHKDFSIPSTEDWSTRFTWKAGGVPVVLTGATGRMMLRLSPTSPVVLDLSTSNGGLVIEGALGAVNIIITLAQLQPLMAPSPWGYDLVVYFPSAPSRTLLEGRISVVKGYTRV